MKSNELKEIIRTVIREELDKTLPTLIPKVLTEILSGKPSEMIQSNQVVKNTVQESIQKPKEIKKYSSNPVLNDILNQTVVKIPSDVSIAGIDSNFRSQAFAGMQINETVETPQPVAPVTEEQCKVMNVLNRDFRSLMKAVDKKKQNGTIGSGMVSMG
jgi:hypothetical protein